jgi:uncharacterized membrane protein YjgN (DUF898 family)
MQIALQEDNVQPAVQDMDPLMHPVQSQSQKIALAKYSFRFHGNASEYFGIWLSNILLTILTLTMYSPWAKSRRLRYFYGNTELLQRRFDFTGLPSKIFLGRLLALEIYLLFLVLSNYSVSLTTLGFAMLYLAVPWLFRLTLKFRSRNSKFGNSRFYFYGENRYLYRILIVEMLKTILSFFILLPRLIWLYQHYYFDHLQIGQLKFKFQAERRQFMKAVYLPLLTFILILFLGLAALDYIRKLDAMYRLLMLLPALCILVGFLFAIPYMLAKIYITTWNHLELGRNHFKTRAKPWRYAWIVLSNWMMRLLTLGLLSAWAEVRLYQYKVSMLDLYLLDDPDQLHNILQVDPNSMAQELSAMFDFDASL